MSEMPYPVLLLNLLGVSRVRIALHRGKCERGEPRQQKVAILQFEDSGVAVVKRTVPQRSWSRPCLAVVAALDHLHLSPRTDVSVAIAGEYREEPSIRAPRHRRPTDITPRFLAERPRPYNLAACPMRRKGIEHKRNDKAKDRDTLDRLFYYACYFHFGYDCLCDEMSVRVFMRPFAWKLLRA